jgi:hypothetical protein
VFPNPYHPPTHPPKTCAVAPVSQYVSGNFLIPIPASRFWATVALRTAVPKATIDKDRNALLEKNKIWFARNLHLSSPARNPLFSQDCREALFG